MHYPHYIRNDHYPIDIAAVLPYCRETIEKLESVIFLFDRDLFDELQILLPWEVAGRQQTYTAMDRWKLI